MESKNESQTVKRMITSESDSDVDSGLKKKNFLTNFKMNSFKFFDS